MAINFKVQPFFVRFATRISVHTQCEHLTRTYRTKKWNKCAAFMLPTAIENGWCLFFSTRLWFNEYSSVFSSVLNCIFNMWPLPIHFISSQWMFLWCCSSSSSSFIRRSKMVVFKCVQLLLCYRFMIGFCHFCQTIQVFAIYSMS